MPSVRAVLRTYIVINFVFIGSIAGHEPATALVRDQLQTDAEGYIITVPGTTQTSVRGVFAAGDV